MYLADIILKAIFLCFLLQKMHYRPQQEEREMPELGAVSLSGEGALSLCGDALSALWELVVLHSPREPRLEGSAGFPRVRPRPATPGRVLCGP